MRTTSPTSRGAAAAGRFLAACVWLIAAHALVLPLGTAQAQTTPCQGPQPDYPETATAVALVFGVSTYGGNIPHLTNATRDAEDMARALGEAKYVVRCLLDPTKAQAEAEIEKVRVYAGRVEKRTDIEARDVRLVFYFAGHGVRTVDGLKDAIIFSASGSDEEVYREHSINVKDVRFALARFKKVHPLIIVDACRNVAFLGQAVPPSAVEEWSGSTQPPADTGFWTQYSTTRGSVASDTTPRFTPIFLSHLTKYGKTLLGLSTDASEQLEEESNNRQRPVYVLGSAVLQAEFLLKRVSAHCDHYAKKLWWHRESFCRDRCGHNPLQDFDQHYSNCRSEIARRFGEEAAAEFFEVFERKSAECKECGQFLVAMLPSVSFGRGEAYGNLSARRISTVVASGQQLYQARRPDEPKPLSALPRRQLRSPDVEADYRLRIETLPDNPPDATTRSRTRLRRLPSESSETATIVDRGNPLTLDCRTLRCTDEWIGVRAQDEKGKVVRGFVPKAQLETAELRIEYDGDATVPDSASYLRLLNFVSKVPVAERALIDAKISARVLGDDGTGQRTKRDEYARAIARASTLLEYFRAARFKRARIGDYFEAQDPAVPGAVVELPSNRAVREALQ
jgi:hypothetical protein